MRILGVEDEARLARNIAQVLAEQASYAVDVSTDGEDGAYMAISEPYDLVILDLMLPKVDGLEILRRIRARGDRKPVLVLTARDTTDDIVRGLDLGCDDYLTKPFDVAELVARCIDRCLVAWADWANRRPLAGHHGKQPRRRPLG